MKLLNENCELPVYAEFGGEFESLLVYISEGCIVFSDLNEGMDIAGFTKQEMLDFCYDLKELAGLLQ